MLEEETKFTMYIMASSIAIKLVSCYFNRISVFLNLLDASQMFGTKISGENKFAVYRHFKGLHGPCSKVKFQKYLTDTPINFS